jgi:hypothetical protein
MSACASKWEVLELTTLRYIAVIGRCCKSPRLYSHIVRKWKWMAKIKQVTIPLSRAFRNFPDVKTRNAKKILWLDFVLGSRWTGPRIVFEMSKVASFTIMNYGHFPTGNGLKLSKVSKLFWYFWKNLLALFDNQIV